MKRLLIAMLAAGALLLLSPAFGSQAMAATTTGDFRQRNRPGVGIKRQRPLIADKARRPWIGRRA